MPTLVPIRFVSHVKPNVDYAFLGDLDKMVLGRTVHAIF